MLVILAGLIFIASENGPIRPSLRRYADERANRAAVEAHWGELTKGGGIVGDSAGPVEIVEFLDYQCPYCSQNEASIVELVSSDPSVSVLIRHYPMSIHSRAEEAALAVVCAASQGEFLSMHRYLLGNDDWYHVSDWMEIADAARVGDGARLVSCMGREDSRALVEADIALAEKLGIRGTPTFLTATGIFSGFRTAEQLRDILQ